MISREQHGIMSTSGTFNTQWVNDLKAIFGNENVTTENSVTTVALADGLSIKSIYSSQSATYSTTVRLYYGGTNLTIATSSSTNYMAYRLIKFDNGVVAFTGFQTAANAADLDAHTNAKRLVWFIGDCTNLNTSTTQAVVFQAAGSGSDPDKTTSFTAYVGDTNAGLTATYAGTGTNVIDAPIMVLTPAFVRSLPLICANLWLKIQSTSQYNTITINGDQYLSCATFCVPLGV